MRRPLSVVTSRLNPAGSQFIRLAAFGVLLTVAPLGIAQHAGAGHAGGFGGGHAGFGGGFSGHSFAGSGGRSYSAAPRSFTAAPRMNHSLPARGLASGARGNYTANWAAGRGNNGRYRPPYRGIGVYAGYPYGASWELTPWQLGYPDFLGYGNDVGYDQPSGDSASGIADPGAAPADLDRPPYDGESGYGPSTYAPASASVAPEPELTLIFNDGHRQAIRNYAVTSDSVIVLDDAASGRQQRIPLSQVNLPATEQGAQQSGLDFTPPA
jgi:hypothetical protein